jgi:hypothetical protein
MYKTPAMKEHDDNLKRIIELEKQVEQYKSDAELGRAVRKAFRQAYNVNPSHGYERGALLSEEALIEWSQVAEDENR